MATKYRAVNAACVATSEGALLYTVPEGRIAKMTFLSHQSTNTNVRLGIKKSGTSEIIEGPTVSSLFLAAWGQSGTNATAVKCMDLGIYFSEGDAVYMICSNTVGVFASLIEEYEED